MIIRDLLDAYEADRLPVVAAPNRLRSTLGHLRRLLGDLAIDGLDRAAVRDYTAARVAEGVQPVTVRRELISLRAALGLALRDGVIDRLPPIAPPPRNPPRYRVLSGDEISRLRAALSGDAAMSLYLDLLLATGARRGAVLGLTWDRVDLDAGQIDYRDPADPLAGRRKHRATPPIGPRLVRSLRSAQRRATGPLVVGLTDGQAEGRWQTATRRAGLDGVTPHVIRHTVATTLLRAGHPLIYVSRLLGHRSVAITEQEYGHLVVDDLRPLARAAEKLLR